MVKLLIFVQDNVDVFLWCYDKLNEDVSILCLFLSITSKVGSTFHFCNMFVAIMFASLIENLCKIGNGRLICR